MVHYTIEYYSAFNIKEILLFTTTQMNTVLMKWASRATCCPHMWHLQKSYSSKQELSSDYQGWGCGWELNRYQSKDRPFQLGRRNNFKTCTGGKVMLSERNQAYKFKYCTLSFIWKVQSINKEQNERQEQGRK